MSEKRIAAKEMEQLEKQAKLLSLAQKFKIKCIELRMPFRSGLREAIQMWLDYYKENGR